jgi:DNA-nicking Smr family endonuclease
LKLKLADQQVWDSYIQTFFKCTSRAQPLQPSSRTKHTLAYTLDLHGLDLQQAYISLKNFLLSHHDNGSKKVKVITGKGGRIRIELPFWCEQYKFIRKMCPCLDSQNQYGSYDIYFRTKKK